MFEKAVNKIKKRSKTFLTTGFEFNYNPLMALRGILRR